MHSWEAATVASAMPTSLCLRMPVGAKASGWAGVGVEVFVGVGDDVVWALC